MCILVTWRLRRILNIWIFSWRVTDSMLDFGRKYKFWDQCHELLITIDHGVLIRTLTSHKNILIWHQWIRVRAPFLCDHSYVTSMLITKKSSSSQGLVYRSPWSSMTLVSLEEERHAIILWIKTITSNLASMDRFVHEILKFGALRFCPRGYTSWWKNHCL